MKLKKGDKVIVRTGKDRGKSGKIIRIHPKTNRVLVEGVNFQTVYQRPSQQNPKGGITKVEGTLHVSNVQLVCPHTAKPTRVGYQFLADKSKVRISKQSQEII